MKYKYATGSSNPNKLVYVHSLQGGIYHSCQAGLDVADVRSYRPISNLLVLSKLLERLIAQQLMDYLMSANLLPQLQSGFKLWHSTETAVPNVLSDILQAVDQGDVAALVLVDLSAAFDTVDHDILL